LILPDFGFSYHSAAKSSIMYQLVQNEVRRSFWRVRFLVAPNQIGFLYRRNQLEKRLEPGIYDYFDYSKVLRVVTLPITNRLQVVTNQEVLTRDNVALRFSYVVEFKIGDAEEFLNSFDVFSNPYNPFFEAEQLIHNLSQSYFRTIITDIESEELNERRSELVPEIPADLVLELGKSGISVVRIIVRDLTFPKSIQDLFAKQLESKIRGKSDLENARTAVATARALKNASELMKGDENIRFVQLLETVTKIADKGKHTFVIGDLLQNAVDLKKS
jgi:regulator of protease activity HflC (stomatin/prohibitin superfamily)